jgi:hypothetical protein
MDVSQKVLLIDLENCLTQIQQLQVDLEHFAQIVICYAHSQAKIPLSWLNELAAAIAQNKLRIIQMAQGGKNSADFGLAFFAGALMQELPIQTDFIIVSNDKDLDHIVHLLKSQKRTAQRIGTIAEEPPKSTVPTPAKKEDVHLICEALIKHHNNRPSTSEALKNSMRSRLAQDAGAAQAVYSILVNKNVITVREGKITYNETPLKNLMLAQG